MPNFNLSLDKSGLCFETGTCKVSERPRHCGGKRALFEVFGKLKVAKDKFARPDSYRDSEQPVAGR